MLRPQVLFAIGASAVLAFGLFAHFFLPRVGITVRWHATGYLFPLLSACVVIAMFFCIFSAAYSIWVFPFNESAAIWHFWLTSVGVLLFSASFWCLAHIVSASGPTPSRLNSAAALGQITSIPFVVAAQALFVVNFIAAYAKFHGGHH
jgi:hypothetical protein